MIPDQQENSLWGERKGNINMNMQTFFYDKQGNPLLLTGVQCHNSSTGSAMLQDAIKVAKEFRGNVLEAPVYWYLLEPEQGVYDTTHVQQLIHEIRDAGLHLVILWFATSKNGHPNYVPEYVKLDPETYRLAVEPDGLPVPSLSPHCRATLEADKRAFVELMKCVKEEDEEYVSPLDLLFQAIEQDRPDSVAVRQYKVFKMAAGKTSKSILVSTAVRLAPFNLPQIKSITDHDDMDLYTLGEKKVALYAVIPDNDTTFNFLVSLLYAQAFQTLYYSADQTHHGALPRHVHFVLDEFAAMPLPGFTRELATMRSRNISASTIIQNMAQIKELYKDSWETILGNSDTILYLGGNEASTHKYISEALGKATIDTRTHGQTKGRSGSYSTNFQMSGRELLTPDEVRGLDNRYAILFIRGARPVMDLKYELTQHPAIRHTVDGGGPPYIHKGKQAPAFTGTPLFQAFSAEELNESEENAA